MISDGLKRQALSDAVMRLKDVAEATPPPISCRAQGGEVDVMLDRALSCRFNGFWRVRCLFLLLAAVFFSGSQLLVAGATSIDKHCVSAGYAE